MPTAFGPSPAQLFVATILNIDRLGPYVRFALSAPPFPSFIPGQFVKVQSWTPADPSFRGDAPPPGKLLPVTDSFLKGSYPLLARAFGISLARFRSEMGEHRLIPQGGVRLAGFDLILKRVGTGTELLSQLKEGDTLTLRGPLGQRGFSWADTERALIVSGGAGAAPLLPLAQALAAEDIPTQVLIGARDRQEFPPRCVEDFSSLGCETLVATEDGSVGHKGMVTELLIPQLAAQGERPVVYACGPEPMIRAVCSVTRSRDIQTQVSLESRTACGVGACLGCVVQQAASHDGHHPKVCVDGPVFDGRELTWT